MNQVALFAAMLALAAVGTAHAEHYTYHGTLEDGGKPAEGRYDLQLTLYPSAQGGHPLAAPTQLYGIEVHAGNFSTDVDFGTLSGAGSQAWLELAVKSARGGDYAKLDSRSPVAPDTNSCPGAWSLDGNAGNPVGSYIGTADTQNVTIKSGGNVVFFAPAASANAMALSGAVASAGSGNNSTAMSDANAAKGKYSFAGGYNGGT